MAEHAYVSSVEALESFRSFLVVYLSKARPILEDAWDEMARTRDWVQHQQKLHWENQARLRHRALENAQQALFSAELSNLREARNSEKVAVQMAKRSGRPSQKMERRLRKARVTMP